MMKHIKKLIMGLLKCLRHGESARQKKTEPGEFHIAPENEEAFNKMLMNQHEEFYLSEIVLVDYVLQGRCAHCRTGRRDAEFCRTCGKKLTIDRLEIFLNSHYEREKGQELPTFNIPKSIDRRVHDLEGFRELNDSVISIPVMDMLNAEGCIDDICGQCKDHHPDRAAAGECKTCIYTAAKEALDVDPLVDEWQTCDHRPLREKFNHRLNQF